MKKYLSYDPENGFLIYDNKESAQETALNALERYNHGYIPDTLDNQPICWGEISEYAVPIMTACMEACK
jgi:hypothetical protein